MTTTLTARNATAADLVTILNEQQASKLDIVVPATSLKAKDGMIVVKGSEQLLTPDGVTTVNGTYRPTEVFDEGVSAKLGIPRQYLRTLRETRPDMYDQNVNGWLHGRSRVTGQATGIGAGGQPVTSTQREVLYPADDRAFLLRLFKGEGGEGVARAMLSNKYALSMDNLDMLVAVQQGITEAGVGNVITRVTDLSERTMRIRFEAPDVNMLAPGLLDGYKDPFTGGNARRAGSFDELRQQYGMHHIFSDKDAPYVFMGFDFTNSETGGGKYKLRPVFGMVKCTNGWVITQKGEGIERTHLGARLGEGVVSPSLDTIRKAGALVAAETRDAVKAWLNPEYLARMVAQYTEMAQMPIAGVVAEVVPAVVAGLGFSKDEQAGVLDMFVRGGQMTAGGIAQAVSAFAQTVEDVDRAYEIELQTVPALERAAARS